MQSRNPTSKRKLKGTKRLHQRVTRNNKPGAVPPNKRIADDNPYGFPPYDPNIVVYEHDPEDHILAFSMIQPPQTPLPCRTCNGIVSVQAINVLAILEQCTPSTMFTPRSLESSHPASPCPTDFKHFMNPAIHPVTGETFTSYKKAMKDPAISDIWQTAFGKELG
jgi:hypothetical protein